MQMGFWKTEIMPWATTALWLLQEIKGATKVLRRKAELEKETRTEKGKNSVLRTGIPSILGSLTLGIPARQLMKAKPSPTSDMDDWPILLVQEHLVFSPFYFSPFENTLRNDPLSRCPRWGFLRVPYPLGLLANAFVSLCSVLSRVLQFGGIGVHV